MLRLCQILLSQQTLYHAVTELQVIWMAKLFGSSGVRGLANVDLTPILACKVASAVATHAKAKKAVVARDTRVSG